ncbi:MAG: mucoidy inhibitor MuiA family protein [Opitutales bacterium]|nr:mucoidy inhibitor MuiA family protein [Opitutales bacterium]
MIRFLLPFFAAAVMALPAYGALLPERSHIDQVVVFPDGARVHRMVEWQPGENGSQQFRLPFLPGNLQSADLTVRVVEGPATVIQAVNYSSSTDHDGKPAFLLEAEEARKAAVYALDAWDRDLEYAESELDHRARLVEAWVRALESQGDPATAERVEKSREEYLEARMTLDRRKVASGNERIELEEELGRRQRQLERAQQRARRLSGVLDLHLVPESAEPVWVEVVYSVRNASWSPIYRLDAKPESGSLDFEMKAQVRQQSGENWDSVELVLSTARALSGGDVPELPPLYLQPLVSRDQITEYAPARARSVEPDSAMMMAAPPPSVYEEGLTFFRVRLPNRETVSGGGEEQVFRIDAGKRSAEFWSEVSPVINPTSYLQAEFSNELDIPLLPGNSEIFIDGERVGRGRVGHTLPGETVQVGLGQNERIRVERTTTEHTGGDRGLLSRSRIYRRGYLTTIENRMGSAHRLIVQDRVPQSRDDQIDVQLQRPQGVEIEQGTGLFRWDLNLEAEETRELETRFTVTTPADMRINLP